MNILIQTQTPPLRQDAKGGLRIGKSRVLLELVGQRVTICDAAKLGIWLLGFVLST